MSTFHYCGPKITSWETAFWETSKEHGSYEQKFRQYLATPDTHLWFVVVNHSSETWRQHLSCLCRPGPRKLVAGSYTPSRVSWMSWPYAGDLSEVTWESQGIGFWRTQPSLNTPRFPITILVSPLISFFLKSSNMLSGGESTPKRKTPKCMGSRWRPTFIINLPFKVFIQYLKFNTR